MRYLPLITIILLSCSLNKRIYNDNPMNNYEIVKIDSISSYYLIYARKNDSLFKIISEKRKPLSKNCAPLRVNYNYSFSLESVFDSTAQFQILDISGLKVKNAYIRIDEPGIVHNLFIDYRMQGLYLCQ